MDRAAAKDFRNLILRMIEMTSRKLRKICTVPKREPLWFSRAKHCLAHFLMDRPFLQLLRSCKMVAVLSPAHLTCLVVGHVMFNQEWAIFEQALTVNSDFLPCFDLPLTAKLALRACLDRSVLLVPEWAVQTLE